jgi:hypothetical protein
MAVPAAHLCDRIEFDRIPNETKRNDVGWFDPETHAHAHAHAQRDVNGRPHYKIQ